MEGETICVLEVAMVSKTKPGRGVRSGLWAERNGEEKDVEDVSREKTSWDLEREGQWVSQRGRGAARLLRGHARSAGERSRRPEAPGFEEGRNAIDPKIAPGWCQR